MPDLPPRLLTIHDVCERVSFGKTWIYDAINDGRFPRPIEVTPGAKRWLESDISAWIEELHQARDVA